MGNKDKPVMQQVRDNKVVILNLLFYLGGLLIIANSMKTYHTLVEIAIVLISYSVNMFCMFFIMDKWRD